jgi:hypothetical protein
LLDNIKIIHLKSNSQNLESWNAYDITKNEIIGHIFMIFELENKIKFMDAWVSEDYRRLGLFRLLWDTRWQYVNDNYKGFKIYAWCKETSLPLLKEKGFKTGEIATYVEKTI